MLRKLFLFVMVLCVCCLSGFADDNLLSPETFDMVKHRQDMMKDMSDLMTSIDGEFSNVSPDANFLEYKIKSLYVSQRNMVSYFDKQTDDLIPQSNAVDEIWDSRDKFMEYVSIYNEAFDEFSRSLASNDWKLVRAAFKKFGDTCWTCHQQFKKPRCRGRGFSLLQRAKVEWAVRQRCLQCHTDVPPKQWQILR